MERLSTSYLPGVLIPPYSVYEIVFDAVIGFAGIMFQLVGTHNRETDLSQPDRHLVEDIDDTRREPIKQFWRS